MSRLSIGNGCGGLRLVVDNGRCVPSETPIQIAVLSLQLLATRIQQDSAHSSGGSTVLPFSRPVVLEWPGASAFRSCRFVDVLHTQVWSPEVEWSI